MSNISDLVRRQTATEKTLAKYKGKPLDWRNYDCIRMLRSHLVAMGHRRLPKIPHYSSPVGALRALKSTGCKDIEALIDSLGFPKIAPAEMLLGDVALLQADPDSPFDAVTISVGAKVMGWHDNYEELVNMTPLEFKASWRV